MRTHNSNGARHLFALAETRPDPYPERVTRAAGVRAHTAPVQAQDQIGPSVTRDGTYPLPRASIALTIVGLWVLAALPIVRNTDPAVVATALLTWLVCGLLLIATELVWRCNR